MNQFQYQFSVFLNTWIIFVDHYWMLFGSAFALMCWLTWTLRETVFWKWPAWGALISAITQLGLYVITPVATEAVLGTRYAMPPYHLYGFFVSGILGFVLIFFVLRYAGGAWDMLSSKLTRRTALERNRRTDIREIQRFVPAAKKAYDPSKFFDAEQGLFIGLDESNKPVYIPWTTWRRSHIDIAGTTGSGKGVAAQVMTYQASQNGEALVVVAPKADEFFEHVLYQAALESGAPYICIDLSGEVAQWNPFYDKTPFQIQELFSAGFGLAEKGTDADFYRLEDRKAARLFSLLDCVQNTRPIESYKRLLTHHPKLGQDAKKFVSDVEEIALLPVLATARGLDLADALRRGAVIYVRGSMRNPAILKLQRIFIVSMMQIVEQRDRDQARQVCFFFDEFKYLISRPTLELLGAIRDKRAHAILAHQSLGDLRDCPADLDPDSVVSAVNENTAIKITYSIKDPNTAKWFSDMSGQILVDDESRSVKTNLGLAETSESARTLKQGERALIDTNMLQSLPERCAALFGIGLAKFFFTSPIVVPKSPEALRPTVPKGNSIDIDIHGMPDRGARIEPQSVGAGVIDVD